MPGVIKRQKRKLSFRPTSIPIQTIRIVMFGLGGVGKSALVNRFLYNRFKLNYSPTIEDEHRQVITHNNHIVDVTVLDTAGSYQFPAMRRLAIQQGHGFIIVYSVDNHKSLKEAKRLYTDITKHKKSNMFPIILVGNKTDIPSDSSHIPKEKVDEILAEWNYEVAHIATSAKMNTNVASVFETLIGYIDDSHAENLKKQNILSPRILSKRLSINNIQTSSMIKLPTTRKEAILRTYSMDNSLDILTENNKKVVSKKRRMFLKLFSRKK